MIEYYLVGRKLCHNNERHLFSYGCKYCSCNHTDINCSLMTRKWLVFHDSLDITTLKCDWVIIFLENCKLSHLIDKEGRFNCYVITHL